MDHKLKSFREELLLTQPEMAEKLKVSLSFYAKVERGVLKASRNFIEKFLTVFPEADIKQIFFNFKQHL